MTTTEYFNAALADGWWNVWAWGFGINYKQEDYDAAIIAFREDNVIAPRHEDVLTKIIEMGGRLHFKDGVGKLSKYLDSSSLERGIKSVPSAIIEAFDRDDYDADTTNEFLQYVLWNKIMFA